nr:TRIC cation channel family protein [uncultured Mediterraneibacter sp.]
MELQTWIVLLIELIGTVAFSVSGAMVGMRRQMDIFGVIVLGVVTAVGGGMMRDVFLGQIPGAFTRPVYVETAVVSAVIPFVLLYANKRLLHSRYQMLYTKIIFLMDSLGLGIFTAMGVSTGVAAGYEDNMFFLCFLGTLTGVGGGLLRDMMAGVPPYIFVKHVYACASITGAVCSVLVYHRYGQIPSLIAGTAVTLLIRLAAAHYRWNLPCVRLEKEDTTGTDASGTDTSETDRKIKDR